MRIEGCYGTLVLVWAHVELIHTYSGIVNYCSEPDIIQPLSCELFVVSYSLYSRNSTGAALNCRQDPGFNHIQLAMDLHLLLRNVYINNNLQHLRLSLCPC